jgi:hypothetical protein
MRLVIGPAVAGGDQSEISKPEIRHSPRGKADILAKLRLDQNDSRRRRRDG